MLFTIKKKIIIAVIPALNEEKTIENVLINTKKYVDKIILVDDGSTDNTAKISEQYANVIRHSKNQGYGKSINDGFELAKKKRSRHNLDLRWRWTASSRRYSLVHRYA